MKKFYEKGPDGKYANAGWPKYVDGILSDEGQAKDKYDLMWERFKVGSRWTAWRRTART